MGESVYLQYPLVGGLDEKTAATYLDAQQNQSSITNGSFRYVGSINKRYGIHYDAALGTASVLNSSSISDPFLAPSSNLTALSAFGNVIFQSAWAWDLKSTTDAFVGSMPACTPTRRPLPVQGSTAPIVVDGVTSSIGTVRVGAWAIQDKLADTWTVHSAFIDPATGEGRLTIPAITYSSTTTVQIVNVLNLNGTVAMWVADYVSGSSTRTLTCYTIDPTSTSAITWTSQNTLALFASDTTVLDVAPFTGDPSHGYIVLYFPSGSSTDLTYRYYTSFSSVATGTVTTTNATDTNPVYTLATWGDDVIFASSVNGTLWLFYYSADGLFTSITSHSEVPSSTLGYSPAGLAVHAGMCRLSPSLSPAADSTIYIAFTAADVTYYSTGGPSLPVTMGALVTRTGSTTVTYADAALYPVGLTPIGLPAQPSDGMQVSSSYIHVVQPCIQTYVYETDPGLERANDPHSLQCTEYLVDYRNNLNAATSIIATVAPRQIDPYVSRWGTIFFGNIHLVNCLTADGKGVYTPISLQGSGISGNAQDVPTHWMADFALSTVTAPVANIVNSTTELSGAVPYRLFSSGTTGASSLSEHGFVNFPELAISVVGSATGLTGTYGYAVCYVRQDGDGNIERSSPVVVKTPLVLSNQKGKVIFPLLSWWATKPSTPNGYQVEIYRTQTLGSTYFCVTRLNVDDIEATSSPYFGGYTDAMTDAQLGSAEILYTTGGLLDNVNPPAARYAVPHRGRYAIVDESLRSVWFTKTETSGEVLGFNEALIAPFIEGGDITAIASLDDKFVVFKSDSIYIQFGDGPADNGQNSDWTTPQLVPSDVGCTSAASVSTAPAGIMFLSRAGFHMLTRGLSVEFVGKGVQDTVSAYPTCIASVAVPAQKQIRWVMQAVGGAQIILVYDYFLQMWTKHVYSNLDAAIVDVFMVDGVYTVLTAKGTRYVESATSYLDTDTAAATHFVPLTVVLPWVKISGAQGYQRSRRTLTYAVMNDPCNLTVSLAFNYDATVQQSKTWTYATFEATGTAQTELHTAGEWNKCEAIQVSLADASSASAVTGQGMTFEAVAFDLDKIGDRYRRLPARLKG